MADRDVRLIIRAKNEATKEIKSVSDAMKVLAKETDAAAKDLKKPVGVMAQLGQEFKRLQSQMQVSEALGKVSDYMQKAAGGVADLKSELATLKASFDKSAAATSSYEARAAELRSTLDGLRQTQIQNRADQKTAIALTNRESDAAKALSASKKELAAANALSAKNPERAGRIDVATTSVASAQAAFDAQTQAAEEARKKVKQTKDELTLYEGQLKEVDKALRTSGAETAKFEASVATVANQLTRGEAALSEITGEVGKFKTALGGADTETTEFAAQVRAAVPQVERLASALGAMQRFSRGNGTYTDPKMAAQFQKQRAAIEGAQTAWKDLESLTREAAIAMRATTAPTEAQTSALRELQSATRAAKADFQAQQAVLATLGSAVKTTFGEFAKATGPLKEIKGYIDPVIDNMTRLQAAMDRYNTGTGTQASAGIAKGLREQAAAATAAEARWKLLTTEVQRLNGIMQSSGGATAQQAAELRSVANAANLAEKEFREAATALKSLESAGKGGGSFFGSINSEGRTTLSLYQRLRGEVLALTAAYVGFYGAIQNIGGVIDAYRTMEAAQNRLGAVFNQDTGQVANELGFIERNAQRLGIEFGVLSDQYSKFAVSANAANISGENTRKIFLSIAEAGRVNKLSLEDMNGVFLAVTQMVQKGRVSSEELRQQLGERLPGAVNIFADALGVTTAELSKMLEQGEVAADSNTLLKFADQLNQRFGPQLSAALQSTSTEIGKFGDNAYQAQLQFANGGFIESFTEGLRKLNVWFRSKEGRDFFMGLGAAAGRVVDVLALIPPNINLITAVIKALIATKVASFFVGIVRSAQDFIAKQAALTASSSALSATMATLSSTTAATGARMTAAGAASAAMATGVGALRGAMTLAAAAARTLWTAMGGWVGVLAAGAAYLVSDYLGSWATDVDDVTTALADNKAMLDQILAGYEQAASSTDRWGEALAKVSLDQIDNQARDLKTKLDEVTKSMKVAEDGATFGSVQTAFRGLFGGWDDVITKSNELTKAFKDGRSESDEYVKQLETLYGTLKDDAPKAYVAELLKAARQADELTTAIKRTDDAAAKKRQTIDGLRGTVSDIKSPLEEMTDATTDANEAFDDGKASAEDYKTALEDIKSFIPGLAAEMNKLKDMNKIQEIFGGLGFNGITPELAQYGKQATDAVQVEFNEESQKLLREAFEKSDQAGRNQMLLETARKYDGFDENDSGNRAGLSDFFKQANQNVDPKITAWCAAFVNAVLATNGLKGTGSLAARSFLDYGESSKNDPQKGDIVVLKRGREGSGQGHVGFLQGFDPNGNPIVYGGNQGLGRGQGSRYVGSQTMKREDVLDYRRAPSTNDDEVAKMKELNKEEEKRVEKNKQGAEATQKRISDTQFEIDQQKLITAGKEREAAMNAAERAARAEDANISKEQVAKVRELAAARYDASKALTADEESKKRAKELDEAINTLETQRNAILQQRKIYEDAGDKEGMLRTDAELAGVNLKLQEAIDKAIAFHQALGGEKAAATVASLNATKLAIANANTEGQKFAMTASQMSDSIYNTLESGIVGMFDTFAQAIANGEDAVGALWTAFRQFAANFLLQIAQMIIKQTLFNALQGFSKAIGGGLFSFTSMHSGGLVGASGVGAGSRSISPAWFNNAQRYHTGGVVGLAPNEVPIVAKEGEEVLTESDARHRKNGGAAGGKGNTKVVNMFDAPSFLSEALNSKVGEDAIFNFVRSNPSAFKAALNG